MKNVTIIDGNQWVRTRASTGDLVPDIYREVCAIGLQGPTFMVWDGPGARKPRTRLFPEYKAQRTKTPEDIQGIFSFSKAILELAPVTQIEVPNVEADDVIAALCEKFHPMTVDVLSRDMDLEIIPNSVTLKQSDLPCSKDKLRLFKTLSGDSADNIKGLPGFGPKSWDTLSEDEISNLDIAFHENATVEYIASLLEPVVPPRCRKWLEDRSNVQLLKTYWTIIGFFEVSDQSIEEHMTHGQYAPEAAREIMAQYLQQPVPERVPAT